MSEVIQRTQSDAELTAIDLGLECFFPLPNELVLDYDEEYEIQVAKHLSNPVLNVLSTNSLRHFEEILTVPSKSGGNNYHVYVCVDMPLLPLTRIALQACLGSDPVKEALSVRRIMLGADDSAAVAMFETKESAKLVREWRKKCSRWLDSLSGVELAV